MKDLTYESWKSASISLKNMIRKKIINDKITQLVTELIFGMICLGYIIMTFNKFNFYSLLSIVFVCICFSGVYSDWRKITYFKNVEIEVRDAIITCMQYGRFNSNYSFILYGEERISEITLLYGLVRGKEGDRVLIGRVPGVKDNIILIDNLSNS